MADLNEKLIECVLDHIETHPDEYNQNFWCQIADQHQDGEYCGTAGCFAGWAVLLSCPVEKWKGLPHDTASKDAEGNYYPQGYYYEKGRKALGLTNDEASHLFRSANGIPAYDIPRIKQRLNNIRKGRGLAEVDYAARDAARARAKAAGNG
jgi:hypothetical protein